MKIKKLLALAMAVLFAVCFIPSSVKQVKADDIPEYTIMLMVTTKTGNDPSKASNYLGTFDTSRQSNPFCDALKYYYTNMNTATFNGDLVFPVKVKFKEFDNRYFKYGNDLSANDLSGVSMVIIVCNGNDKIDTQDNADLLKEFVSAGGRVVMVGENPGFCPEGNVKLSSLAEKMGGGFEITNNDQESGIAQWNASSDLSTGLSNSDSGNYMYIGTAAPITCKEGTTAISVAESPGKRIAIVADQQVENGSITAISDIDFIRKLQSTTDSNNKRGIKQFLYNLLINSVNRMAEVAASGYPSVDAPSVSTITWGIGDDTARSITVSASSPNEGTLTYQWHQGTTKNFTPGEGNAIAGATGATYQFPDPDQFDYGTYYYKCVVTNTKDDNIKTGISQAYTVNVVHMHYNTVFTPWDLSDELPHEAGNYYLKNDVTLSSSWYVPDGNTVLCLNGHSITSNAPSGAAIEITEGILQLDDCSAAHSGVIRGGSENAKTGINVHTGRGLFMFGGTVTGFDNEGISVENGAFFAVSGRTAVKDNDTNIFLGTNSRINIMDSLDPASDLHVTINGETGTGVVTQGLKEFANITSINDAAKIFKSDNTDLVLELNSAGELIFRREYSQVVTAPAAKTDLVESSTYMDLITAGESLNGTMEYTVGNSNETAPTTGWSSSIPREKASGTYYVWYKTAGDQNHEDTEPVCVTVVISPRVVFPSEKNMTYDGTEQELVNAGSAVGGTVLYSLGENSETAPAAEPESNWSTSVPKRKNAGDYYVWYKIKADPGSDLEDTEPVCRSAEIKQRTLEFDWSPNAFFTGRPVAPNVTITNLAEGDSCELTLDIDENAVAVGDTNYTATITACGNNNYKLPSGGTETIYKIVRRKVVIKANNQSVALGHEISKDTDRVSVTGVGFTPGLAPGHTLDQIVFTADDTGSLTSNGVISVSGAVIMDGDKEVTEYYYIIYEDGVLRVYDPVTPTPTPTSTPTPTPTPVLLPLAYVAEAPVGKTLPYTGASQTLAEEGTPVGGTLWYALTMDGSSSPTLGWKSYVPSASTPGTYYIWYWVVGDSYHRDNDPDYVVTTIGQEKTEPTAGVTATPTPAAEVTATPTEAVKVTPSATPTPTPVVKIPSFVVKEPRTGKTSFTGEPVGLLIAGTSGGGTFEYALGTDDVHAPESGYVSSVPTATSAGTYYVWYRIQGDALHTDSAPACITVVIDEKAAQAPEKGDYYEEVPVQDGSVRDITGSSEAPKEENPLTATINNVESELEELLDVKPEEKAQGVNVWLEVTDVTEYIPEEEKQVIEEAAEDYTVALYMDVSMFKKVGNKEQSRVHETSSKVKISFVLPEELRGQGREYSIVRYHNGEVEIIKADYDPVTNLCSFETDRFSSYAIIYTEDDIAVKPSKTGGADGISKYVIIMLAMMASIAILAKKYREEER